MLAHVINDRLTRQGEKFTLGEDWGRLEIMLRFWGRRQAAHTAVDRRSASIFLAREKSELARENRCGPTNDCKRGLKSG